MPDLSHTPKAVLDGPFRFDPTVISDFEPSLLEQHTNMVMRSFVMAEERLVRRMMRAWNFDAWGEPALVHDENIQMVPMTRWDAPPTTITLKSDIIGLARATDPSPVTVDQVLVRAEDHLAELENEPDDTAQLMEKILAARAKEKRLG